MVHRASYATTCLELFQIISNCVQQLVVRNPAPIAEIMEVGIYLLRLHPHLWTSVANSSIFPNFFIEVYFLSLKKLYYEFLLINFFFNCNPVKSINIKKNYVEGLFSHFSCANVMAKKGCVKFKFHKIVFNPAPTPRVNNSTTNISELTGFIMESNKFQYAILPQFLKQCIHLYNSQIQQMMHGYYY